MRRFDDFKYEKSIKASSTGQITARVYRIDKKTKEQLDSVGLKFFTGGIFIRNIEKAFKDAHKWADERIRVCEENESGADYYV